MGVSQTEQSPTSDEVDLYWTRRELLPADRLAVLSKHAKNFPRAERYYQEFRASQTRVNRELDDAIRNKTKE
jgi:hypothetical protein